VTLLHCRGVFKKSQGSKRFLQGGFELKQGDYASLQRRFYQKPREQSPLQGSKTFYRGELFKKPVGFIPLQVGFAS
jgi:hypothetical protein